MPDDLFGGDRAHARRSDPQTSHRAADVVSAGLNAIQRQVEAYGKSRLAGFLDIELVEAIPDLGPSTLRTRRAELVARNILLDSGKRITPEGHSSPHTVWIHRDFVAGAPPVCEPTAPREPLSPGDIDNARALAVQLDGVAKMVRTYGLVGCEQVAEDAAALLRRITT
jgi:hypothetical protein